MHPQRSELEYYKPFTAAVDERIAQALGQRGPDTLRTALIGIMQGGKRIRPLLAMASARAAGGCEEEAVGAAAAIELLHTSSLIHDDIMDHSSLRRGKLTIHALHGVPLAILAGDALIAIAFRLIHSGSSPRKEEIVAEFTDAFLELCEGQALDLHLAEEIDTGGSEHHRMVQQKTARLFEAAAVIGALTATSDASIIRALRVFGLHVGMAYQAKDDLLDAVGTEQVLGKPVGNDSKNGKQTYLRQAHPQQSSLTTSSVEAVGDVASTVWEFTERAIRALEGVPAGPAREHLRLLAASLAERRL